MAFLIQTELPEWQTATLRNELCFRTFQYVKKAYSRMPFQNKSVIIKRSSAMRSFFKNTVKSAVWEQPDYFLRNYSFGQY